MRNPASFLAIGAAALAGALLGSLVLDGVVRDAAAQPAPAAVEGVFIDPMTGSVLVIEDVAEAAGDKPGQGPLVAGRVRSYTASLASWLEFSADDVGLTVEETAEGFLIVTLDPVERWRARDVVAVDSEAVPGALDRLLMGDSVLTVADPVIEITLAPEAGLIVGASLQAGDLALSLEGEDGDPFATADSLAYTADYALDGDVLAFEGESAFAGLRLRMALLPLPLTIGEMGSSFSQDGLSLALFGDMVGRIDAAIDLAAGPPFTPEELQVAAGIVLETASESGFSQSGFAFTQWVRDFAVVGNSVAAIDFAMTGSSDADGVTDMEMDFAVTGIQAPMVGLVFSMPPREIRFSAALDRLPMPDFLAAATRVIQAFDGQEVAGADTTRELVDTLYAAMVDAGTMLRVDELVLDLGTTRIALASDVAVDETAEAGVVVEAALDIANQDALVTAIADAGIPPRDLVPFFAFVGLAESRENADGEPLAHYDIALTPEGTVVINGTEASMAIAEAETPAEGAPAGQGDTTGGAAGSEGTAGSEVTPIPLPGGGDGGKPEEDSPSLDLR
ncbi:MAG: hypothetical protein RLO50_20195 [Azospirillaceae bacterium]